MSASPAARLFRQASRTLSRAVPRASLVTKSSPAFIVQRTAVPISRSIFTSSSRQYAGLMPDTPDPQPPKTADDAHDLAPAEVSIDEYHEHADRFMNALHEKAEQLQETREDVEVEYSAGVLSITFPPNGTYVINKQPPNKQIWLSSPLSGPKRYDWVVHGESMHQKEGGGVGDWIYLRDESSLSDVVSKELGLSLNLFEGAEDVTKPSIDPVE